MCPRPHFDGNPIGGPHSTALRGSYRFRLSGSNRLKCSVNFRACEMRNRIDERLARDC
jgi:hypothetical protein